MKFFDVCAFLLLIYSVSGQNGPTKRIVCYFASWTVYRPGNGQFDVGNIDPNSCTHINFGFIGLNDDASIHILDDWESGPSGWNGFANLVALKNTNPDLKVLVSMGGWNEGSRVFSSVAANETKRKILSQNVLEFVEEHDFDGFDLDWEYPGLRGGNITIDKSDFTALLKELNAVLKPNGYLLTAAVGSAEEKIDIAYDIPAINDLLDYMSVMTFDFHGQFDNFVGHIAPLYPATVDFEFENNKTYNVDAAIQYWLEKGADPLKLNLGLATYGRSFTLANPANTSLYAPVVGGGTAGPYSQFSGVLGYNEICEFHNNSNYVWDEEQKVPHRYWDNQWVGFEDERSIALKVQYLLENELGGAMVWSFDYDDFRGICGDKYPLLSTVNKFLKTP